MFLDNVPKVVAPLQPCAECWNTFGVLGGWGTESPRQKPCRAVSPADTNRERECPKTRERLPGYGGRLANAGFVQSEPWDQSKPRQENEKDHLDGNVAHRRLDSDLQKCVDFPGFNRVGFGRGWARGAPGRRRSLSGIRFV